MRRCRPDKIPMDVQARILDAAVRAPTGGNTQNWRFMLVDDAAVLVKLGPIYRRCLDLLWKTIYKDRLEVANAAPDEPDNDQMLRVQRSAQHLADHFEEYPLLLFSFVQFDPTGGSIFPATWSAMLAARAEGVGSSITSVFFFEIDAVLEVLGVPKDEGWLFSSCVTMGYPTGVWGVAPRRPVHEVSFRNHWGTDVGFTIEKPLWPRV
jgi:nitroreductase